MVYTSQVSKSLDEEHRASLDLLERLERALAGPVAQEFAPLAGSLARQLEHEIGRHFEFEESELFTRLAEAGDTGVVSILSEEHENIRAVAGELLPLVRAAGKGTLALGEHPALRQLAVELIERMVSHIQKETMALLPMLDDLLDPEVDQDLALAYAGG